MKDPALEKVQLCGHLAAIPGVSVMIASQMHHCQKRDFFENQFYVHFSILEPKSPFFHHVFTILRQNYF
jgi:hypothetical protein